MYNNGLNKIIKDNLDKLKFNRKTSANRLPQSSWVDNYTNGGEISLSNNGPGDRLAGQVRKLNNKPKMNSGEYDYEKELMTNVNPYLQSQMELAKNRSINTGIHNGPLDAIRHAGSAAGTATAVFPSWLPIHLKIIGTNVLGAAHEFSAPGTINWQETGSDLYNNFVGSIIGSLPISNYKKQQMVVDAQKTGILSNVNSKSKKIKNKAKGRPKAEYGGDISLPNVYPNQMVPRFDNGGGTKKSKKKSSSTFTEKVNKGLQFNKDWMRSPMYNKMLQTSIGIKPGFQSASDIASLRKHQLDNVTWEEVSKYSDPNIQEGAAADAYNFYPVAYPQISKNTINYTDENTPAEPRVRFIKEKAGKDGNDLTSDSAHEFSHIADMVGDLIPPKDLKLMRKYRSTNYLKSPLYTTHVNSGGLDLKDKEWVKSQNNWLNYINDPTETRARLNDFRMRAKEQGLYDPFTQPFDIKYFKKYKPIENTNWDPIYQLRGSYSDEEISDMLNKISKSDNKKPQTTAKYGGSWLDKYGPGGQTTDGCPPGFNKNSFGQCVNASGQTPGQANTSRNIINQVANPGLYKNSLATPYKTRSQEVKETIDRAHRENYHIGEFGNQASIGQGYAATPESEARRKKLNEQYASTHPYAKIDNQGNLSKAQWDRNMEGIADPYSPAAKLDRGVNTFAKGMEYASYATGLGSIGSNMLRLGATGLEGAIGRNLLSKNLKNFTGRINPTLNAIDEVSAYSQLDPVGIIGNKLNAKYYNPTTALNTSNNTITGLDRNLKNSAVEGADLIAGQNNLEYALGAPGYTVTRQPINYWEMESFKKRNPWFDEAAHNRYVNRGIGYTADLPEEMLQFKKWSIPEPPPKTPEEIAFSERMKDRNARVVKDFFENKTKKKQKYGGGVDPYSNFSSTGMLTRSLNGPKVPTMKNGGSTKTKNWIDKYK